LTALELFLLDTGLVFAAVYWPKLLGIDEQQRVMPLAVLAFGSLGGLLSSLLKREPLSGDLVQFYVERAVLLLQPIIGATAGLIIYLLLDAKILTIQHNDLSPAICFVYAFCAGFSERFFLRQLGNLLGNEASPD
jgi:hypothetical protein